MTALLRTLVLASALPFAVAAQEVPDRPRVADPSVLAGASHPELFDDVTVSGYEQLVASLSVENSGAKVSWAPLLARPTYSLLSEVRLQLSQKDGLTRLGVGLRFNPFAPRGGRGNRLWEEVNTGVPNYPLELADALDAIREDSLARSGVEYELLQARQALVGAAEGGASNRFRSEADRLEAELLALDVAIRTNSIRRDSLGSVYRQLIGAAGLRYRERLAAYRGVVPSVAYSAQVFPNILAQNLDADGDGLNDGEYAVKDHTVSVAADWFPTGALQVSAVGTHTWRRTAPEEGSPTNRAAGGGLTVAGRVYTFDGYRSTDAYKKSLFVPGVTLGLAAELEACVTEAAECAGGTLRTFAITPFVDIRLRPETQLRVGVTGVWKDRVDEETGGALEPVSVFSIQLGLPRL